QKWVFGKATDDVIATFIERKVYWQTKLTTDKKVWIADPTDAQYLETSPAHLVEIAGRLVAGDGLVRMEGEWAEATPGLIGQAERFENAMRVALQEVEEKHAYERG
ncbi:MAG TPA: hypothetical protein VFE08_08280, partial [Candidatus Sulfotelmatobacter sp.]|nr:hypothetical protein [Candidatus Sulfotelmatobacter sp.]